MSTMERDILISRVVDGLATDPDWRALERLGDSDPTVWRELAVAQRQQVLLCGVVERSIDAADEVDVPDHRPSVIRFPGATVRWSGWAAAAMVALAWMAGQRGASPGAGVVDPRSAGNQAGMMTPASWGTEDYLQGYLAHGQQDGVVVGQMPSKPVIEIMPRQVDGGTVYDVVYARVILERTRLPDVYRLTTDEFGGQIPVRTRLPERAMVRPPM